MDGWEPVILTYVDDAGRLRYSNGRFAPWRREPDETCPNGCARYGDWWIPEDCATHLAGAS